MMLRRCPSWVLLLGLAVISPAFTGGSLSAGDEQASRTFQILENGREIGTEVWFPRTMLDTGFEYRVALKIDKPVEGRYKFTYRTGIEGKPQQLVLQFEGVSDSTHGEYIFGDKEVEARITTKSRSPQIRTLSPAAWPRLFAARRPIVQETRKQSRRRPNRSLK